MVRLKSRYVLFEVLYPEAEAFESENNVDVLSKRDILLRHHQVTPARVTVKTILQELRRVIQFNFGDYGSGKVNSLLQIKYFSNRTSTGIIRCSREEYEIVVIALTLMNKIDEIEGVLLNPIKVSGTIKRIEQYAIRRSARLLNIIQGQREVDKFDYISDDENED
ncbi:LAQU0S01e14906g1_1 [Lachancea quebecensis]|uniref:Ribonuclease P/MRP protein subunit POP5 n=1 Tax=Lachancea quebecensis TaxID=1654605 RepID=A0A0N7MKY8_9SACH|nr:LAQU0S01e14906g1_1 [Lachancea quebecensis]